MITMKRLLGVCLLVGMASLGRTGVYLEKGEGVDEEYQQSYGGEYQNQLSSPQEEDEHKDYYDPPHYTYEYKVDDYKNGDFKRHRESRQDGAVKGYYSLVEADGSLRTVHYTADDKNGFTAVVTKTMPGEQQGGYPEGEGSHTEGWEDARPAEELS